MWIYKLQTSEIKLKHKLKDKIAPPVIKKEDFSVSIYRFHIDWLINHVFNAFQSCPVCIVIKKLLFRDFISFLRPVYVKEYNKLDISFQSLSAISS